jgi:hypothetical protein
MPLVTAPIALAYAEVEAGAGERIFPRRARADDAAPLQERRSRRAGEVGEPPTK